jgi:hypothetical protein
MTTTIAAQEKLDLAKLRPEAFRAGTEPVLVTMEPAYYLVLRGRGDPNDPQGCFQKAIAALYSVAFPLKMRYKAMALDYKMPPLEALWWEYGTFGDQRRDIASLGPDWCWKAMLMVPDYVQPEVFEAVKAEQLRKKGLEAIGKVEFELVEEGLCVQAMHDGPYAEEPRTIKAMRRLMEKAGLRACGQHHEVYFSDPHRTAPQKLRTLLRQPVRRIEDDCTGGVDEF